MTENNEQKIKSLKEAVNQLLKILEEENQALKKHDIETIKSLVDKKNNLALTYQRQMQYFAKAPEIIAELPETEREDLRQNAEKLEKGMKENERLLKVGMEVNNKLLEAVVETVRKQETQGNTYSACGNYDKNERSIFNINTVL